MPKKSEFPKPTKRFISGAWVILWRYSPAPGVYKQYTVSTGLTDKKADEPVAENILRRFAAALTQNPPVFPKEYIGTSGVCRYLEDRLGADSAVVESGRALDSERWLQDYDPVIKKECEKRWAHNSLAYLKHLDGFVPGGIGKTNAFQATRFLEHIHKNGLSAKRAKKGGEGGLSNGTRNRALAACSRFFNWCIASGRLTEENPFKGIKSLKEAEIEEIVYCMPDERDRIIASVKGTGRPDWIAVPIAFYAGCRREEIFQLDWARDINLKSKRILIRVSKTGKRTIPIAKELLAIFEEHQKQRGLVVPRDGGTWENQADRIIEVVREHLCVSENPTLAGMPHESIGKRKFLMTETAIVAYPKRRTEKLKLMESRMAKLNRDSKTAYNLAIDMGGYELTWNTAHDGGAWLPAERVGWNAFRHTFGSLLAQAGVSPNKITSWMGNSENVFWKHYGNMVPRDRHDEDIDKL